MAQNYASEVCKRKQPEAFCNNVLCGVTKPKWKFLATTKEGIFWRKKTFVEKNTLPTKKHGGGSIVLWGCVATGGTGNIVRVEGRMDLTKY